MTRIVRSHYRYKRPARGRHEMIARILGIVVGLGYSATSASAPVAGARGSRLKD